LVARAARLAGDSEAALRLPSALLGALTVPLLFALGARWIDQRAGWTAAILLAVSPLHLWHSRDARMYAQLAFLGAACMLAYAGWLERPRPATSAGLAITSALAYLTHYFALFLPLIQFIHLALHMRSRPRALRSWTAIQAGAAVPLAAWLVVLWRREGQFFGIGWIPEPGLSDLLGTLVNFTVGYTAPLEGWKIAAALICLAFGIGGMWATWRDEQAKSLAALWALLPALVALGLSVRRPVYMDRFLILSLPAVLLLISSGIEGLGRRRALAAAAMLLAVTGFAAAQFTFWPGQTREQWREAAAALERVSPDEAIVVRVLQIVVPLSYYYDGSNELQAMEVNRQVTSLSSLAAGHEGTWLVYWNASADIHRPASSPAFRAEEETDEEAAAWLAGRGPQLLDRLDYTGVTLLHFGALPRGAG
jgi:uncharacterized membrane protein